MTTEFAPQLAAAGKRSGKFRHIYGEPVKPQFCHKDLSAPMTCLKANHKFFAVPRSSGGGPVYVHRLDKPGRFSSNEPYVAVQKGKVVDVDFHPFITNMIATASEDCSVAVSSFPEEGLTQTVSEAEVMLKGHGKKVQVVRFHPCASNIISSGSFDGGIRVWNVETGECIHELKTGANIFSMEWNRDGSQLAVTAKDKKLRIYDPRSPDEAASVEVFKDAKQTKLFWMDNLGWIGATGVKGGKRSIRFFDLKKLVGEGLHTTSIDQSSGVLIPEYDHDSGLLFTFGKGDSALTWKEIINDDKVLYELGKYGSNVPQKGGGFVTKKGLDVWKCEIMRFLKLTSKDVIPIPLMVPRKAGQDVFQEDIYPEAFAGRAALSADEWISGENREPVVMSLDPDKRKDNEDEKTKFVKKKTYNELLLENEELRNVIKNLEEKFNVPDEQKYGASEEKVEN